MNPIRRKIRPLLKLWLSRSGSLLALFQRTPFIQMLLPEAKILGTFGGSEAIAAIATVAGLGAFDSVAGATVNQTSPTNGGTTFTFTVNQAIPTITFQDSDGHTPTGWRIKSGSGSLPPGLTLPTTTSRTNTLTGTPTTAGSYSCQIQAYDSGHSATSPVLNFTVNPATTVTISPTTPVIVSGQTAILTATSTGTAPITYQWYQGASGTTTTPVGTNSPSFTTPSLTTSTSYWCRTTDAASMISNSSAATVTVVTPVIKASSGTNLATSSSWTGGTAPSGTVSGKWTSTSLGGNLTLGNFASGIYGLAVTNPSTDINITGTTSTAIGGVGFDLSSSTVNMSWAPPVVLAANQFWKVNSAKTLTVSGVVSATTAYSLSKDGAGTLALNGANTYIGTTNVKGGTLKLGTPTALGSTAAGTSVVLESELDLNGQAVGTEALTLNSAGISGGGALNNNAATAASWAGAVTLAGNSSVGGTGNTTISGVVSGAFSLTKAGTGTTTLTAANTYSGNTVVSSGVLKTGGTGSLGGGSYAGAISLTGTLECGSSTAQTLSGIASGTGALALSGTGTLSLTKTNTYTGGTTISAGILSLDGGGGINGTIRGTATVSAGATLRLNTGDATGYDATNRISTINLAGGGTAASVGALHVNTTSNQTLGNTTINLTGASVTGTAGSNIDIFLGSTTFNSLASATTSTIAGVKLNIRQTAGATFTVADGAASTDLQVDSVISSHSSFTTAPLIKAGPGTMTLTAANTYSGATNISAGKLVVNGTLATATAAVTVNSGASLGGTGPILRPLTVNSGGTVAPGNSAGTLSVTGTTALNGTLAVEVDGTTADKLAVAGNLTIGAGAAITVNLLAGGFTQASYVIAECTGGTLTGTFTTVPVGYKVTYTTNQAILSIDNTNVTVSVSPAGVAEDGAANLVYTFTRTGSTATPLTVNLTYSGTATAGTDFPSPPTTVVIPAGSASSTWIMDPAADSTVEGDETVTVSLATGSGYSLGSPASATATINNDDSTVSVAVSPSGVPEDGPANLVFTVTRSGPAANALTVNLALSGTAAPGNDYPSPPASVTIPPGLNTATLTIDPTSDAAVEGDETVTVSLTAGGGYTVGSPAAATASIINDDTAYSSWASALPVEQRAMNLTPQNDGVKNLLKFAFNLDPTKPDVRRLTAGGGQTAGLPVASRTDNRIRIEYIRRKSATNPGITYTAQCGSNLTGWTLPLSNEIITSIDTEWERVTVDGPAGQTRCFGRVMVNQP